MLSHPEINRKQEIHHHPPNPFSPQKRDSCDASLNPSPLILPPSCFVKKKGISLNLISYNLLNFASKLHTL